jgi:hypothetical protein
MTSSLRMRFNVFDSVYLSVWFAVKSFEIRVRAEISGVAVWCEKLHELDLSWDSHHQMSQSIGWTVCGEDSVHVASLTKSRIHGFLGDSRGYRYGIFSSG